MGHSGYAIRKFGGKHRKRSATQGRRVRIRRMDHQRGFALPKNVSAGRPDRYGAGDFYGRRWHVPQTQTGRGAVTTHSRSMRKKRR